MGRTTAWPRAPRSVDLTAGYRYAVRMPPDPPDLATDHHAISLHFKWFPSSPEWAWHAEEQRWYERAAFETKVALYADRVRGWFLQWGDLLDRHHDAGFVVLMLAVSYLEGNQQYREGRAGTKSDSAPFFKRALLRVCPGIREEHAGRFYGLVRCGLFHDGFTKHGVGIENRFRDAVKVDPGTGDLLISPRQFLALVKADFDGYVRQLMDPAETELRANFEARWGG